MRVFLSHSSEDAELVRRLQRALESRHIEVASMLGVPADEAWRDHIDHALANADAFICLLGPGASVNPYLQAEWRALLRDDWHGTKLMIPVLLPDQRPSDLPGFLAKRSELTLTNFDELVERIVHRLQNPQEGRRPEPSEEDRAEHARRLDLLKDYAEALRKQDADVVGRP